MFTPNPADALLDTNLLTGYPDLDRAQHGRIVRFLHETDLRLHVAPQSLYEFWAVATRPRNVNGLQMLPEEAGRSVDDFRRVFAVRPDPPGLLDERLALCRTHGVSGKNARDFARYGLAVVVP